MRDVRRFWLVPVVCGLAIPFAAAQDHPTTDHPKKNDPRQTIKQEQPGETKREAMLLRTDHIIGNKVVNRQDENLGDINDIVVDVGRGRIGYAVLSHGGLLGMGTKFFAIPWDALKPELDEDGKRRLVLDISRERLEQAPGFDKNSWPDMADPEWGRRVHRDFDRPAYWERDDQRTDRRGIAFEGDLPHFDLRKVTDITGSNLRNLDDEDLGSVRFLVFDGRKGRAAYAVMAHGGVLGMGQELYAVPFSALSFQEPGEAIVLNLDRQRLDEAPRFTDTETIRLTDEGWGEPVHTFYGVEPYWADEALDERALTAVSGEVTGIQTKSYQGQRDLFSASVRADDGQETLVLLAPQSHLRREGVTIREGDQLSAKGEATMIDGKKAILASTFTHNDHDITLRKDGKPVWDDRGR